MTELDNSTDKGDVSEETNDKSNDAGIGDTSNTNQNNKVEEKKYSDKEVDDLIKRKHGEWSTKSKKDFEKSLEGKHILTEDDLKKLRDEAINEFKVVAALESKRTEYKAKGLSDAQLDAIQVDDITDYDKRASELFGVMLKKEAPKLNGGSNANEDGEQPSSYAQQLQQKLNETKKKYNIK